MVKKEAEKITPAPIAASGEPHPGEGKRQGSPTDGGFLGSARPPVRGREGAPVGEEVGRERVSAGIAEDLLSQPNPSVRSPHLSLSCPFVGLLGRRPQGSSHKATLVHSRSPSSACSRPLALLSLRLSSSLRGSFQDGILGGAFFLGSQACARTLVRCTRAGDQPASAHCSRQAGLSRPGQPRPGWLPRALLSRRGSQRQLPLATSPQASVARFLPHPHEILRLTSPCRRPLVLWASGLVPQDSS